MPRVKKSVVENGQDVVDIAASDKKLGDKYRKKTPYEHIRDLPDTYIGSTVKDVSNMYIVDSYKNYLDYQKIVKEKENKKFKSDEEILEESNNSNSDEKSDELDNDTSENNNSEESKKDENTKVDLDREIIFKKEIEFVPGLYKIYDEIMVNANDNKNRIDNKIEKKEEGYKKMSKMSKLEVEIFRYSDDKQEEKWAISVLNDGDGIDVAQHPEEKCWIPEMIFGQLLTSGNYDKNEEKVTGGKNGYGAKLTNIFSTYFRIETVDRIRGKYYSQVFRNNMLDKEEPEIKDFTKKPFTKITFIPDYKSFNLDDLTDDLIKLFKKRTYDMVFCSKNQLKVKFNKKKINGKDDDELHYIKYYLENDKTDISYCSPHARWQIGACMSPNFTFQHVGFVNGIYTTLGGRHVDYVQKQICNKLANYINRKHKVNVKDTFIRDNLMLFVNSLIVNPGFNSQTKDVLTTNVRDFGSKFDLPDEFIVSLSKCGIVERALALNQFQESHILKKTDGKKTKRLNDIPKLEDAIKAGTKLGSQCTLILTEGDSAKSMAMSGIGSIPNGHEYYGVFPLRGKLVNTREISDKELAKKQEIINIKRILGLQEGKVYEDTKSLRYGRIMIMTDQDVDGTHIKGLLINYFACSFPSLLQMDGFITSLLTPIVKCWKGKDKSKAEKFYNLPDYEDWLQQNNGGKGYKIKYYKGLGTSSPTEAKEYFKDFKLVTYHWDDLSDITIDKAFNKKRANDRKTWLKGFENQVLDLGQSRVTYTDFIDKDLIHFSMADNIRSIPNLIDGFKPGLRKVLYSAFKRNLKDEIKVSQLAGYVSEHSAYHHGEASLLGTIVGMAQNYVGSNNINLFHPEGQFGTRFQNGKDHAAPRYIFTYLEPITRKIFRTEDEPLLKWMNYDGDIAEPEYYYPIIPMLFVNGSKGIGTGWSTDTPSFSPKKIIENIRNLILGEEFKEMKPYYRGFKGTITKSSTNKWVSHGCYNIIDSNTVEVTEIPVGTTIESYKELLISFTQDINDEKKSRATKSTARKMNNMKENKKLTPKSTVKNKINKLISEIGNKDNKKVSKISDEPIRVLKDYQNKSTDGQICFTLEFYPGVLNNLLNNNSKDKDCSNMFEEIFKITSKISCGGTMTYFNKEHKLTNYKELEEPFREYYEERLRMYEVRRNNQLIELHNKLDIISYKAKFIQAIIKKKLKINNVPKDEIINWLKEKKYPMMSNKVLVSLEDMEKDSSIDGNYNYLTSMPIFTLTKEKVEELLKEKGEIEGEVEKLNNITAKQIWLGELNELEEEYEKHSKSFYSYYDIKKEKKSKSSKKTSRKSQNTKSENINIE
jgi:DNA topoisomerase-2